MVVMLLEWIFTSAFLILVVLALRAALGKRVSARLRYTLWAVVLVRLLVPVQLFTSPLAGTRIFSEGRMEQDAVDWPSAPTAPNAPDNAISLGGQDGPSVTLTNFPQAPNPPTLPDAPEPPAAPDLTRVPVWLGWAWLAGSAAVALVLLVSNLRFYWKLRRERIPLESADCPLRVYAAVGLPSPCLFGLFRPAIYVTPEAAADPDMLRHVLAHEYTHYRQGDHLWSLLRCGALAAHWWNPLVWLAAVLSQRDAELACDEGALKRLGDGERAGYGNTLLALVTAKPRPVDLLRCATTMAGDKKSLKERISRIAKAPKRVIWAVVVAVLVTALACVCAFGQAEPVEPSDDVDEFTPTYTMSGDRNVLVEGLDGAYVEWSRGTNGGALYLAGDMAFCCPRLAGEASEGGVMWTDAAERSALTVSVNVDDERIQDGTVGGFGIHFTADLARNVVTQREFTSMKGDKAIKLTDQEMLGMARVLARLLTEAEDYYNSQNAAESETQILDCSPDLNRNSVPETITISPTDYGGIGLEVWENNELIFSDEGYYAHAGWNAVFLCTLDGEDYLLRYHPTMYQGYCNYEYQLFTLSKSGEEQVVRENSIEFDINFHPLMHQSFDPEAIAAFMDEINGLLANSVQLINTDENLLSAFEKEGRLYDSLWWLDLDFTRDPSKSMLENLRDFKAAMEGLAARQVNPYLAVIQGKRSLYSPEHGEWMTLDEFCAKVGPGYDKARIPDFSVLDLDGDGVQEVVLNLDRDYRQWCVVLHEQDGEVRGYALYIRWMNTYTLKEDGAFDWSSSAFENGWGKLRFTEDGYETIYTIWSTIWANGGTYYIGDQTVSQAEYDAANRRQEAVPDAVWQDFTEETVKEALLKG